MNWKTTTQPTFEPISLAYLKAHTKNDLSNEDELLLAYIANARSFIENRIELAIPAQTITLKLDEFPHSDRLLLPRANLISLTSVSYIDTDEATQTTHPVGSPAADYYGVDTYGGAIFLKSGQTWPSDVIDQRQAITIVYRAGWEDEVSIPGGIQQAVAMLAAHWDRNREAATFGAVSSEIDFAVSALIEQYRVFDR